jgi:hypothetical protein
MRNGTPGQLTDPLPLIRIESPHLKRVLADLSLVNTNVMTYRGSISAAMLMSSITICGLAAAFARR